MRVLTPQRERLTFSDIDVGASAGRRIIGCVETW
jgi:hypothetical protein